MVLVWGAVQLIGVRPSSLAMDRIELMLNGQASCRLYCILEPDCKGYDSSYFEMELFDRSILLSG